MRLLQDLFLGNHLATARIAIEQAFVVARQYPGDCLCQCKSIVHAAIHAHAARRRVEVRCISGEDHIALPVRFNNPVVDPVGPNFHDLVRRIKGNDPLQLVFDR